MRLCGFGSTSSATPGGRDRKRSCGKVAVPQRQPTLMRVSSSSSPRMANWRWRGVIRFTCEYQGTATGGTGEQAQGMWYTVKQGPSQQDSPSDLWRRCPLALTPLQSGTLHARRPGERLVCGLLQARWPRTLQSNQRRTHPELQLYTPQPWLRRARWQSHGSAVSRKESLTMDDDR